MAPWLFFWFLLLRRGYAASTRIAAASYMLVPAALALTATFLAPPRSW
ncbi:hypothetical protein [Sphingomonas sp. dw_22]|nr:hypothetical protein [Sphingomonas sp. dw_22]